jgi:hypothetical protein
MSVQLAILAGFLFVAPIAGSDGPTARPPDRSSDFEFHRDLAPGRRFYLANIIGNLTVTGGSGRTVEVTAIKKAGRHGAPEDVSIETVELDDGVALCVRYPHERSGNRASEETLKKNPCAWETHWEGGGRWTGNGDRNDTEVNFTVKLPAGLRLHLSTVSGDVAASGLEGGELALHSVSGNVRLEGGRGPSIELETVSGDVRLLDISSKEVSGRTISGEIEFRGAVQDGGSYDFSTTSGDIALALPQKPNATLSAATFSGDFTSDLPVNQDSTRRHRHRYDATWGSGSAKLYLESLSGDLAIKVGR